MRFKTFFENSLNSLDVDQLYDSEKMANRMRGWNIDSLSLPNITKKGKISVMHYKKNPIYIRLTDGTEAYFTLDQFRRIKGEPAIGKVMSITFQRHPNDNGSIQSKIDHAIIED